METPFTQLVGCRHPLQQAAMGGVATPELAAAVARAGALGMLCEYDATTPSERIALTLELAAGAPIGMGFFGHWIANDLATFELAAAQLRVVEIFWSTPDAALVDRARGVGSALVAWQVGSVHDAKAAADAGCDFVIAQGVEAGGHVYGTVPRDFLLAHVLNEVTVPVVVAGGIATAEQVTTAIAEGAAGVRIGTRFVAAEESSAHPAYVDALINAASGDDTILTTTFATGWPDAPHRVLQSCVDAADSFGSDIVGHVLHGGERHDVPRYAASPPTKDTHGAIETMALYAGTGVGAVDARRPAAEIVAELVSGLA